jgi:hypothetical protein
VSLAFSHVHQFPSLLPAFGCPLLPPSIDLRP